MKPESNPVADKQLAEYWERKARAHFKMAKTHSQSGARCALKARELFLRAAGKVTAMQNIPIDRAVSDARRDASPNK